MRHNKANITLVTSYELQVRELDVGLGFIQITDYKLPKYHKMKVIRTNGANFFRNETNLITQNSFLIKHLVTRNL